MSVAEQQVPAPPDIPRYSARQLLRAIKRQGGRVYRMRSTCVFVLTDNPELAQKLVTLGARSYMPRGAKPEWGSPLGSFTRAPGAKPEWDLYIHTIPVRGEESMWEAAGRDWPTVEGADFG